MTNLLATILITVVTNSWHPKMPVSENYYFLSPTNNIVNCGDGTYSWPTWPLMQTQDDPDTLITEVREIESLSFAYKGKEYRVETGNRLLSTVTKRRKVKQTEEWVEEPSYGGQLTGDDITLATNTCYYSVTNLTTESTVATNTIISNGAIPSKCRDCQKKLGDLPDSPSAFPLVVLEGDVDSMEETK